ncbi:MAG: anti-sigma regulatory factor [Deltaproteobacteria bacterium]|nr:anti-sigma regulatory factor [Deltaproteobacteria bacterium]MBW2136727.1 anti-sigma regulatory factor [Deltaproteobacteria bacterium]
MKQSKGTRGDEIKTLAEALVMIGTEENVLDCTTQVLRMAEKAGLSKTKRYMVATAVSELATNILRYAGDGAVTIKIVEENSRKGIEVVAQDGGPGISDVEAALKDHFSTSKSLGLGLPGARRLADEFVIESGAGRGTSVIIRKWC